MKKTIVCICFAFVGMMACIGADIQPHPRLLANAKDFDELKVRLEKSDLGRRVRARLLAEADEILKLPRPVYKKDESGRRILHISREMINESGKLALSYRLTGNKAYLDKAAEQIRTACEFKDWNPSHFLDTAEMTFAVALCYDWLYDWLSDSDRELFYKSILNKGLLDGEGKLNAGSWVHSNNNWCQVCHGGLVSGAIAIADRNPELVREVIDRAVANLPHTMKAFAPDGGFPEGTGYWQYAMEYNVVAIWAIEKFDGSDHGLCSLPGFKDEVDFMDACTGPSGAVFNFSDCGGNKMPRRGMSYAQWWLARRFDRQDTLVFKEISALERTISVTDKINVLVTDRFFPLLVICLENPAEGLAVKAPLARVLGGDNPIAVMRTSWTDPNAWYVGLKGGRPSASHGHMDIGSFVLEANGVRWTYDLGCEPYARIEASEMGSKLWDFSQASRRWNLFRYSTRGHGTLQFADERQLTKGMAEFTPIREDANGMSTTLDMSKVSNRNVKRTFGLGKKGGFLVVDDIKGAKPGETVTWRINTFADVKADGNVAVLTAKDVAGNMRTMKVQASSKDIVFKVVDCSKRTLPYEENNPGLKQLEFTRTIPASGNDAFVVGFSAE